MAGRPNGAAALEELFWRDEILQAMFWLRGEGLAEEATGAKLAQFLVIEPRPLARQLARLVADGYLERLSGRPTHYRLTERGRQEGGRRFRDEFAELTHRGHGECAPGCICHDPAHAGEPCPSHKHEAVSGAA